MASENDTTADTTSTLASDAGVVTEGGDTATSEAPPAKKATRKRAPRKAAAPAAAPSAAPAEASDGTGAPAVDSEQRSGDARATEVAPDAALDAAPDAGQPVVARKTARKTATKKAATKATRKAAAPGGSSPARDASEQPQAAEGAAVPDAPVKRTRTRAKAAAPMTEESALARPEAVLDEDALELDSLSAPAAADSDTRSAATTQPADRSERAAASATAPATDLGAVFQAPVAPRRRATAAPTSESVEPAPAASPRARRSRRASSAAAAPALVEGATVDEALAGIDDIDPSSVTDPTATLDAPAEQVDREPAGSAHSADSESEAESAVESDVESDTEPEFDGDGAAGADAPRRRRRRGGKGRRGRGPSQGSDTAGSGPTRTPAGDSADNAAADATGTGSGAGSDAAAGASDEDAAGDASNPVATSDGGDGGDGGDAEGGTTGSRRRTRRRRRSGGGDADDTPGVTTRVREPREPREPRAPRESRSDEVTALKGSTRLEAKKQRRREGREAGRRRTVITEAEFLARRESVERVMVVRHVGDRTQIGVLEDEVLVEHYISKETSVSMAGNIYLGRVQNVLPSMEAAFVDIGKGRNAVLYAGEVNWDAAGLENNQAKRIENALSSGESVLVQVTKDPIGHKGARLTSQISLPGRYLVYVPNSSMTGISRKLPDTERARLKKILKEVVPSSAGVIVRTAAEGASEEELRADVERLTATWDDIVAKAEATGWSAGGSGKKGKNKSGNAPVLLHGEPDLTVRVIRDIFNEDFSSLVVAGEQAWNEVSEYVASVAPDLAERVTRWTSERDLFSHYRVDEQIAKAMDRKVYLPSGGSLVIDRTEAMTVVDVNTGKFIGSGGNLEETVTKNNIEAAEEIVRQLRLRDVGGIIVIDFIDMVLESNRDLVVRRLLECLGRDRTKHQVAEVTSLGLVQMTRKRVGSGLIEVFSESCEHCAGRGFIIHTDPVGRSTADDHARSGSGANGTGGHGGHGGGSGSGGSNGGNGGNGGTGGNGGRQSSRGRGQSTQGAPEAAAHRHLPSGPTPAQIAAAAHAAALKTAEQAVAEVLADAGMPEGGSQGESESAVVDSAVVESAVVTDIELLELDLPAAPDSVEPSDSVEAVDVIEAVDGVDDVAGGPAETPQPTASPEIVAAPEPQQSAYVPPVATPVAAPRRRRGRVVAPAGPPRGADTPG